MTIPESRSTLYVRACLLQHDEEASKSSRIVADWINEAVGLLNVPPNGEVAYRLLARIGAIRRARPDLLAGRTEDLEALEQQASGAGGRELAELARGRFSPADWLDRARAFAWVDAIDDVEQSTALLIELDEADLVFDSQQRLGLVDDAVETALDQCAAWFWEHAWAFTGAASYAQAVAATFRPDLEDHDLFLVHSANKFVMLLDVLEELALEDSPEATTSFQITGNDIGPSQGALSFRNLLPSSSIAAAASTAEPPRIRVVEWTSPDGRFQALLRLPLSTFAALEASARPLNFVRVADGEPASELAGRTCRLGHLESRISSQAQAIFTLDEIRSTQTVLTVGSDAAPWTLDVEGLSPAE